MARSCPARWQARSCPGSRRGPLLSVLSAGAPQRGGGHAARASGRPRSHRGRASAPPAGPRHPAGRHSRCCPVRVRAAVGRAWSKRCGSRAWLKGMRTGTAIHDAKLSCDWLLGCRSAHGTASARGAGARTAGRTDAPGVRPASSTEPLRPPQHRQQERPRRQPLRGACAPRCGQRGADTGSQPAACQPASRVDGAKHGRPHAERGNDGQRGGEHSALVLHVLAVGAAAGATP
jgi:hypothetical protein